MGKGCPWQRPGRNKIDALLTHRLVGASGGCSGGRENVLAVGNCCYVAVCTAAEGAHGGRVGWGHAVVAAHLQLVEHNSMTLGWCNNPTARQFRSAFRAILCHSGIVHPLIIQRKLCCTTKWYFARWWTAKHFHWFGCCHPEPWLCSLKAKVINLCWNVSCFVIHGRFCCTKFVAKTEMQQMPYVACWCRQARLTPPPWVGDQPPHLTLHLVCAEHD